MAKKKEPPSRPMKKHEACHHLNVMIEEARTQLADKDTREISETVRDLTTMKDRPCTPEELDQRRRWRDESIAELNRRIEALDIAASNLTK